ncbi:acyltransferase [Mucilaginibacter robiniae]|uniref:Acyltransferase n=1 Tax=Mucilaginibacter robiniae TaxID=2728022 RepID=A0A7L5E307_9SPHI|nr:acyltransferase [Mucilaginibacter robiniae]QJD95173.1 acyltransferase [Mucilaginibacter robiniae]
MQTVEVLDKVKVSNNFRYDINALRAVAILGVLLFHYNVPFFAGGFSGVDVFFVISGYLMSRIIINSIDKSTFSFIDFYSKRIKRIVPALLIVILTITIICFFFYFPEDYKLNEKYGTASLIFLSNILYWKSSGYFDPASNTNIFLHTWSLSVEWQFYMLYPIALLILSKLFKKKPQYWTFFILSTISIIVLSFLYTQHKATASFYLLPSRSWEMMFGGIAFFAEEKFQGFNTNVMLQYWGILLYFFAFTY